MTIKLMSGSRVVQLFEYFFGVRFIGKGHRNNLTNVAFPETITRQKFQYENVLFLLNTLTAEIFPSSCRSLSQADGNQWPFKRRLDPNQLEKKPVQLHLGSQLDGVNKTTVRLVGQNTKTSFRLDLEAKPNQFVNR